jgi:hypothetical protein
MKYRSLLLHTWWSIYFWLIEFKLVFEFLFQKWKTFPSFLSYLLRSPPTEVRSCPLSFATGSPSHHRRSSARLAGGPAQPNCAPRRPLPLTGGSRPSSSTLGRSPTRARTPNPSRPYASPWSRAHTPRSPPPPRSIKPSASHCATPSA